VVIIALTRFRAALDRQKVMALYILLLGLAVLVIARKPVAKARPLNHFTELTRL
jgi:hypothetical protein